jgi:hypothetical protein
MPRYQTIRHLGWPDMQRSHVLNLTAPILASSSRPSNPPFLAQAVQQISPKFAFRHDIQSVVDRLVRHPLLRLLGVKRLHRAGDLLGRPALPEEVFNHAEQDRIRPQLRSLASLTSACACPVARARGIVRLALNTMPGHFATDRARRSLQGAGDRADTGPLTIHQHHRRPFFRFQLFVLFSHRNSLHGRVLHFPRPALPKFSIRSTPGGVIRPKIQVFTAKGRSGGAISRRFSPFPAVRRIAGRLHP